MEIGSEEENDLGNLNDTDYKPSSDSKRSKYEVKTPCKVPKSIDKTPSPQSLHIVHQKLIRGPQNLK